MDLSNWHISAKGKLFQQGEVHLTTPLRIVYIDDHRLFRNGIIDYCIRPFFNNVELIQFSNGTAAANFLESEIKAGNKIDLVITDINHPGLKGNHLVRLLRDQEKLYGGNKRIPVIVISMVEPTYYAGLLSKNLVDHYLLKTAAAETIIGCMEELLYYS